MAARALGLAGRALLRPLASPGAQRLLSTDMNPLQGLTNGDPMSRLMQTQNQNGGIYHGFAENAFTGGGGRMGGNTITGVGGRMGGDTLTGSGGRSGRFNMEMLRPAAPRVKRDVLHITLKGKKTFVTVTDVKGNRKAGASAGCLEDRKGRSRLARYAGEATGEHMGRSASKIGLKSVVVRVKGYSFFQEEEESTPELCRRFTR